MNKSVARKFALKMVIVAMVAAFSSTANTNPAFGQNNKQFDAVNRANLASGSANSFKVVGQV
jgi:hypothetical protein